MKIVNGIGRVELNFGNTEKSSDQYLVSKDGSTEKYLSDTRDSTVSTVVYTSDAHNRSIDPLMMQLAAWMRLVDISAKAPHNTNFSI